MPTQLKPKPLTPTQTKTVKKSLTLFSRRVYGSWRQNKTELIGKLHLSGDVQIRTPACVKDIHYLEIRLGMVPGAIVDDEGNPVKLPPNSPKWLYHAGIYLRGELLNPDGNPIPTSYKCSNILDAHHIFDPDFKTFMKRVNEIIYVMHNMISP